MRRPPKHVPERAQALRPVLLEAQRRRTIRQLRVLHRDLALRHAFSEEAALDRRPVRPGDAHRLVGLRDPNFETHVEQPAGTRSRIAVRTVQPGERYSEGLTLARFESAIPALADGAQTLDPLVSHRHRLAPPIRGLVLRVHVLGDATVR